MLHEIANHCVIRINQNRAHATASRSKRERESAEARVLGYLNQKMMMMMNWSSSSSREQQRLLTRDQPGKGKSINKGFDNLKQHSFH